MLSTYLPQVVVVVNFAPGTEDDYGNAGTVESGRVTTRARLWQESTSEATVGRDTATSDWHAILELGSGVDEGSQVECDGKVYAVDGVPEVVYGASSAHHVEARLHYAGPVT